MSIKPRTFVKSTVSYGEMIEVLEKLGYRQEIEGDNNRLVNKEHNSIVLLAVCSPNEMLEKVYLETYSRRLYNQGVIEHEDGILRLIEKNRLKKNKKIANKEQVHA